MREAREEATAAPTADPVSRLLDHATRLSRQTAIYVGTVGAGMVGILVLWHYPSPYQREDQPGSTVFILLALLPVLVALTTLMWPRWLERRRLRWLVGFGAEVAATDRSFPLRPLGADDADLMFPREGARRKVLALIDGAKAPIIWLTGLSGSGKTSLLASLVMPELGRRDPPVRSHVVRSYADPIRELVRALKAPGAIWGSRVPEGEDARQLLERAARKLYPARLLIVLDQFEEFVLLHEADARARLQQLLASLLDAPIPNVTLLGVCRSDYLGALMELGLPDLRANENWLEISPLQRAEAAAFLARSGLKLGEALQAEALDEAAEVEESRGQFRPITLNMLGRALECHQTRSIPRRARGRLIPDWLRGVLGEPHLQEIAPRVLEPMITESGTKRPLSEVDLAQLSGLAVGVVRGCLARLSLHGVVRELDREHRVWEIAHDFVAKLLLPLVVRARPPRWRRMGTAVASTGIAFWLVATGLLLLILPEWRYSASVSRLSAVGFIVNRDERTGQLAIKGRDLKPGATAVLLKQLAILPEVVELEIRRDAMLDSLVAPEELHSLRSLTVIGNPQLSVLDLTGLRELTQLRVSSNDVLAILHLPHRGALSHLTVSNNAILASLDLSNSGGLAELDIIDNDGLASLDLSSLGVLARLTIIANDGLASLALSERSAITELTVGYNSALASLDLSGGSTLIRLIVTFNDALTKVELSALKGIELAAVQGQWVPAGLRYLANQPRLTMILLAEEDSLPSDVEGFTAARQARALSLTEVKLLARATLWASSRKLLRR